MACAHHIDDRLAIFQKMGFEPILLTSLCVPKWDKYLHYRVPSLSPSGLRFELRQFFLRKGRNSLLWKLRNIILLPLLPLYALERLFVRIDTVWYWLPFAYLRGKWICKNHKIAMLYSTGGPAVAHSVGYRLKNTLNRNRKNIDSPGSVKWLAEVQDPLIHSYCANSEKELQLLNRLETTIYDNADKMIFLTSRAMENTEKRINREGKGAVVYPGAVPVPRPDTHPEKPLEAPKMIFGHFGSLGGVRNLAPLIAGLKQAITKKPEILEHSVINLYGGIGDDDQQRIAEFEFPNLFTVQGKVPRADALAAMGQCDVLLLIQGKDPISTETIPSKLYEYLHVGCPVLAIVYENPEIETILTPLGHVSVSMKSDEIAKALLNLFNQWQNQKDVCPHPSPYTVEKAVEQFLALSN